MLKVTHEVWMTKYSILQNLPKLLKDHGLLSFDIETRSVYDQQARKQAKDYIATNPPKDETYREAMLANESSGLSCPAIIKTTHFIFGVTNTHSIIVICKDSELENMIWKLVSKYQGTLLVHNSLFDLKVMDFRGYGYPKNVIDTALLAKCLVNHVDTYKAKVGLKILVGDLYKPSWALYDEYEVDNYTDPKFIEYCAIDGAATIKLWELLQIECAKHEGNQGILL